jgi:hypothetical protein
VGLANFGSESETCVGSCVRLIGASISFEKNFYELIHYSLSGSLYRSFNHQTDGDGRGSRTTLPVVAVVAQASVWEVATAAMWPAIRVPHYPPHHLVNTLPRNVLQRPSQPSKPRCWPTYSP